MFDLGLVSVSFRALSPREIVDLCAKSHLSFLEWGGDVHVPPGDSSRAREVAVLTRESGLQTLCYGSYYRCDGSDFEPILEAAMELDAPRIRVWAGIGEDADFNSVLDDLLRVSHLAKAQERNIVLEFHSGTLTHNARNARALLDAGQGAFSSLWQPLLRAPDDELVEENLDELHLVAPFLKHVHAYEWRQTASKTERVSLGDSVQWPRYLRELRALRLEVPLLLEFVPDDDPQVLAREAAALRAICEQNGSD